MLRRYNIDIYVYAIKVSFSDKKTIKIESAFVYFRITYAIIHVAFYFQPSFIFCDCNPWEIQIVLSFPQARCKVIFIRN